MEKPFAALQILAKLRNPSSGTRNFILELAKGFEPLTL
jgi:hypothetical protein